MAVSGTITKVKNQFGLTIITITGLTGAGNQTPVFVTEGYPFGSAQIVVTGGSSTGDKINFQVSNDGQNFNNVPPQATSFPAMTALSVANFNAPASYYAFQLDPTSTGSGVYTLNIVLSGARG